MLATKSFHFPNRIAAGPTANRCDKGARAVVTALRPCGLSYPYRRLRASCRRASYALPPNHQIQPVRTRRIEAAQEIINACSSQLIAYSSMPVGWRELVRAYSQL